MTIEEELSEYPNLMRCFLLKHLKLETTVGTSERTQIKEDPSYQLQLSLSHRRSE